MQNDLVKRLRIKADMIQMGEKIAWGSDSEIMREAADYIEKAANTHQPVELPAGYDDWQELIDENAEYERLLTKYMTEVESLRKREAVNEWFPIDYAKSQNRYFLLFDPDTPRWDGNMEVGKWWTDAVGGCFWSSGGPNGGGELEDNYTRCMELPGDYVPEDESRRGSDNG